MRLEDFEELVIHYSIWIGAVIGLIAAEFFLFAYAESINLIWIFLYALGGWLAGMVIGVLLGIVIGYAPRILMFVFGAFLTAGFFYLVWQIITFPIR